MTIRNLNKGIAKEIHLLNNKEEIDLLSKPKKRRGTNKEEVDRRAGTRSTEADQSRRKGNDQEIRQADMKRKKEKINIGVDRKRKKSASV